MSTPGNYCTRYSRVAWSSPHPVTNVRFFVRLRCKQWSCEYCAEKNAAMWRAHLLDNVNKIGTESTRWSFVTLTSHPKIREPHKSYNCVNKAFREISKLWRGQARYFGGTQLEYARTMEAHENGAIHLHAIVAHELPIQNYVNIRKPSEPRRKKYRYFDQPQFAARHTWRIGDLAAHFGAGYKAESTRIADANAGLVVAYITKYISKNIQQSLDLPPRARRIVTSRGFGKFGDMDEDSAMTWESDALLSQERYMDIKKDCEYIYDTNKSEKIDISSFNGYVNYPPLDENERYK